MRLRASLIGSLLVLCAMSAACGGAAPGSSPAAQATSAAVVVLTPTPTPLPGAIEGKLSYPGPYIPPLRVYAVRIDHSQQPYVVSTVTNQPTYHLDVVAGIYNILAYVQDPARKNLRAGYTRAVLCGLMATCNDHSLISITVQPGETVRGADPGDWYAPYSLPPEPQG